MDSHWLENIKESVIFFINEMNEHKDFSYFRYSYSGDLFEQKKRWGLGQLVFGTKILYILDEIKILNKNHRINLINSINSFQNKDGYYTDTFIFKISKREKLYNLVKGKKIDPFYEKIKRAETRQSFAALSALDSRPLRPFLHIPYTKQDINSYLEKLNWKEPWDAGSHFSHLLFFLHFNRIHFELEKEKTDILIDYAIKWLNNIQSSVDGCWYIGEPSISQKINGAMKILTGLSAINRLQFSYPERIIDTILSNIHCSDACNEINDIFVLHCCKKLVNYRDDEIRNLCLERLKQYRRYFFEDKGGFSFHQRKANDNYYGAKITKGLNEPDIHGTALFLWGITLISNIIELD